MRQLRSRSFDPRIEFFAADHAIAVGVDQTVDRLPGLFDLHGQAPAMSGGFIGRGEASFVFFFQQIRVAEKFADILPHGIIQLVGADLFVVADLLAAEAIRIRSHAAIIRVRDFSFRRRSTDLLAVVGVPAAGTFRFFAKSWG